MAAFKNVPELVRINGKWTIHPFVPMQAAFDWDKHRGSTATLYVMQSGNFCKIGITTNLKKRLVGIANGNPMPVKLVASRTVPRAGLTYAEAWLHKKFAEYRVNGEWFDMDASFATGAMSAAVVRAKHYARCCAEWFAAEEAGKSTGGVNEFLLEENTPAKQREFVGWPTRQDYDELFANPDLIAALDSMAGVSASEAV